MGDDGILKRLTAELRQRIPGLLAVYAFGSRARGEANAQSDFDLAFLAQRSLAPLERWQVQEALTATAHADVDLVDLSRASSVMRVQVLKDSVLLFDADQGRRELFEATALGAYARLNDERRGILKDIADTGRVHG